MFREVKRGGGGRGIPDSGGELLAESLHSGLKPGPGQLVMCYWLSLYIRASRQDLGSYVFVYLQRAGGRGNPLEACKLSRSAGQRKHAKPRPNKHCFLKLVCSSHSTENVPFLWFSISTKRCGEKKVTRIIQQPENRTYSFKKVNEVI